MGNQFDTASLLNEKYANDQFKIEVDGQIVDICEFIANNDGLTIRCESIEEQESDEEFDVPEELVCQFRDLLESVKKFKKEKEGKNGS